MYSAVGSLETLGLSSYGVQSTSLEEVFLYLASHSSVLDASEDAVPPHEHRPSNSTVAPAAPSPSAVQPPTSGFAGGDAEADESGARRRGSESRTREERSASISASALNPAIVDSYVTTLTEGVIRARNGFLL